MGAQDKDAAGAAVPTDRTGSIKIEAAAVELITEERMGIAESQQVLEANLQKLKAELASEAGSAGSLSFYGVALLHAIVLEQRCMQAAWTLASILLCLLGMLALHSIAFSMSFQKCVYDDDCLLGRVCVRVPKPHAAGQELKFYHQSICADCYDVIKSEADHAQHVLDTPGWVSAIEALTGVNTHYDAVRLTDARTQDRWPYATTATEFCQNYLEQDFVQAWSKAARAYHDRIGVQATANAPVAASDFSRCLHVSEAMERRGEADLIVTMIAFILVCLSISADRKQQLLNQHLRQMLLPPPWRSLRSAAFKLLECILAALLPTVCLSMILLLFGSASLTATDVLLNGVAVAFVLLVDDELPAAILSDVDRKAIDEFAEGVGDVPLMMAINKKGNVRAVISFVSLLLMYIWGPHNTCDNLVHGALAVCSLTPIIGRIAEEIAAAPYTLELNRRTLAGGERLTWRQGCGCFLKAAATAVVEGVVVSFVVILTARLTIVLYLLDTNEQY